MEKGSIENEPVTNIENEVEENIKNITEAHQMTLEVFSGFRKEFKHAQMKLNRDGTPYAQVNYDDFLEVASRLVSQYKNYKFYLKHPRLDSVGIREMSIIYENDTQHANIEILSDSPTLLKFEGEIGLVQHKEIVEKLKELDSKFKKLSDNDVFGNNIFEIQS